MKRYSPRFWETVLALGLPRNYRHAHLLDIYNDDGEERSANSSSERNVCGSQVQAAPLTMGLTYVHTQTAGYD